MSIDDLVIVNLQPLKNAIDGLEDNFTGTTTFFKGGLSYAIKNNQPLLPALKAAFFAGGAAALNNIYPEKAFEEFIKEIETI